MHSPNKAAALALVSRGLRIFPCNPDKTPMIKAWEQSASNAGLFVDAQWSIHRDPLPAIPVGVHKLVVFDCDRKPNGPDGVQAFTALCRQLGVDLSNAFAVETPSQGLHLYFTTEAPYGNSRGALPDGIDVRGVGGYVIAPGALLPDGRTYRQLAGSWDAVPALPEPLAALLRQKQPLTSPAPQQSAVSDREHAYALNAIADEIASLSLMREGQGRNRALNEAAYSLGTMAGAGWIDPNQVADSLMQTAIANGYVAKDGIESAKRTIESGLNAGIQNPRAPLVVPTIEAIDITPMVRNAVETFNRRQSASQVNGKRSVNLIQGSEIEAKPITWLWEGYLPAGKLTLLAGAGGTGKSTIAFSLASTITNAGAWPDGSRCNIQGNVLIWSSEDDPADTIKPRLMAVAANERRYGIISGVLDEHGISCAFDAGRDMEALRESVNRIGGVSMLIIDPIVTAVTGDMHKANDVRRSLQSIVDFAAEANCAVLGITHFAKGTAGKNSADRVIGSQAFAALARMVLVAAKEEESARRVFTRAKSNNSVDTGGFNYSIEPVTIARGIVATRVVWGEALEGSSTSILSEVETDISESTSKRTRAKVFLQQSLANGPVPSKELMEHAREAFGISKDTMRLAQEELGIVARKLSMQGGWVWELPFSTQRVPNR